MKAPEPARSARPGRGRGLRWKTLPPKANKYHAKATVVDGIRFDSKIEADYYRRLLLRQRAGEVVFFLRQVPLHLPGGVIYRVDFLEFHADGSVHFVDTKGVQTEAFRVKKRIAEATYPVEIEIVDKVR